MKRKAGCKRGRGERLAPLVFGLALLVPDGALAQDSSGIPSPSEFHGFDVGERYIVTSRVVDYYRMLGDRSPRVVYEEYGRSIQGRPLPLVMVGSEANLARRDAIQEAMQRLGDPSVDLGGAGPDGLLEDLPALVWLFIVDTDEEAGVNVLQEVAHELATSDDPGTQGIRDDVVVIMTPLTNPDSHARYVTWHMLYDVQGASVDPNAVENDAHWGMNTDGNAYGIDVNRDFGVFVSPEMQALARVATKWRPQFWLDIHSGPDVIFLPPFPRPFHPLWPDQAPDWWERLARRASENFGRRGWTFNSREGYEGVTSVTFGLSWGMLGPSVSGMLFETFGGRPGKTAAFIRSDGSLATMRMAMDRHREGIFSLLQVARDHRADLLRDAREVVLEAQEAARGNRERSIIIPGDGPGVDPDKVARLVNRLTLQGIRVTRATSEFTQVGTGFLEADAGRRTFPAGSYIVDLVQPQARLARALLDPTIDYGAPQIEVPFRTKMPYYDSSWGNLALLFGVQAFASPQAVRAPGEPVGAEVPGARATQRTLDRDGRPYAWVLPAGRESSYRSAIQLMKDGYRVRVFRFPFRLDGRIYEKGTFAVLRGRNPEGVQGAVEVTARRYGAELMEVPGPFTEAGTTFGDDARLAAIPNPRVAIVADWPVTQDHTYGGIRNTLEADFGFTFTPVMLHTLETAPDLDKYTAIVLPHAGMSVRGGPNFGPGYSGRLDPTRLRSYVRQGGTLIAVKGAAAFIATDPVLGAGVVTDGWAEHTDGATLRAEWMGQRPVPVGELLEWRPGMRDVGRNMLGAGFPEGGFAAPGLYPVLLGVDTTGTAAVAARYDPDRDRLLLDGFMLDEDRALLAGRPFVIVAGVGRGRVVYFADDPTFRGYWYGLNTLFLNSLMFGPLQ